MSARARILFTSNEAAVLTRLPLKAVHNAIDKKMVSTAPVAVGDSNRMFDAGALLALMLEQRLASRLFPDLRRRLFGALNTASRHALALDDELLAINIDLCEPRRELAAQLRALRHAKSLVVSDAEILGGEPVFRGTRVPVHVIAKLLEEGETERTVLAAYPRLTVEMIRLAPMYAQAYPLRGRPRRQPERDRTPVRRIRVPLTRLKKS